MKIAEHGIENLCLKGFRYLQFVRGESLFLRIAVFIFLAVASPAALAQNAAGSSDSLKPGGNYQIGVGDVLQILVVKQALLSADGVRVGGDGKIRLPMLETSISAACLTETELAAAIIEKYRKYLLNPQVYVAVKEYNANPIALLGAVNTPGRFQLQRPTRLLELLTFVNGPSANAGKTVQIIRNLRANRCRQVLFVVAKNSDSPDEEAQEIISLPLAKVLKGDESANPFLQSGDIIRVSEAEVVQAFVVGSVKSAAAINLKEPVTLSKAIAMAGGVAPDANIEKIKISRQQPNSLAKTELVINLKEINKRNQEDILLQPNDIVDVPGASGTKKLFRDIFRTALPTIARVPVSVP